MKTPSVKYKAIKNEDVSEALLDMASPVLKTAGKDEKIIEALLEIAVKAWNISLFPPSDTEYGYGTEIEAVMPRNLVTEKRTFFKNFMIFFITEKQKKYPDYLKGIRKYEFSLKNGIVHLKVDALPVKPFKTR